MARRLGLPRLLPATMLAMAALLGVKSVALVRAAAPEPSGTSLPGTAVPSNGGHLNGAPSNGGPPGGARLAGPSKAGPSKTGVAPAAPPQGGPALTACPPALAVDPTEQALLLDLRRRNAALTARASALDLRETVLKAAEKQLSLRVAELAVLQKKLAAETALRRQRDGAKWQALVRLYENMQPRRAATIFDGLPMRVLLGVMRLMNERKAAPILAAMQPDKARALTARLVAGTNATGGS